MDLHKSQAQTGGLEAPTPVLPTNHEIPPSKPTPPSLVEISKDLSQQPPVEVVSQGPIIGSLPIRSNGQINDMHILIVDDNDINLQVSWLTTNSVTQRLSSLPRVSFPYIDPW